MSMKATVWSSSVEDLAGQLARDDLAEDAVGVGVRAFDLAHAPGAYASVLRACCDDLVAP